jgi:peptidoglycan/xylan/chitin deacetylase (PgdA/CDA1 family)
MRPLPVFFCLVAASAFIVAVLAYGLGFPEATLLGPALVALPTKPGVPEMALTFDDGPSPYTGQILDVLKAERVKATFFLCGENALRYPELVKRIRDEGHEIGNHTWSHPYLHLKSRARISEEIDRTQDALEKIAGVRPRLFRPPFGVRWFSLWPLLDARGLTMVMWTVRGIDASGDADGIARTILGGLRPGAIALLHDGFETRPASEIDRAATVRALPIIIRGIRAAGYAIVSLPDDSPSPLPGPLTRIHWPDGLRRPAPRGL